MKELIQTNKLLVVLHGHAALLRYYYNTYTDK